MLCLGCFFRVETDEEYLCQQENQGEDDAPAPQGGALTALADVVGHGLRGRGGYSAVGQSSIADSLFQFVV